MEGELSLDFVRAVEGAAIEAARTMGRGDRHLADQAAVEAMRHVLDTVPMAGKVVIGEGERDEAPMLYIGEKVGLKKEYSETVPEIDIAVEPLEGTNLCATGAAGAIAVLAASEHGGLLHAPDCYMEKIVVGPSAKGAVDLDAPVKDNLRAIARRLEREVEDLVVVVLDRPRHEKLVADIREAGARIRLIGDGDLSAGITAAVVGTGVHAVMGTGGAPEGVLTGMGITDATRIYGTADLAPGKEIIFAATGVTEGSLLKGVRFFGDGIRTHSLVMTLSSRQVRFIDSVYLSRRPDVKVRF